MTYTKINLYLANGIPEALSNLWYGSDSAVVEIRDAVEDAKNGKDLLNRIQKMKLFRKFTLDRENDKRIRFKGTDCWGNVTAAARSQPDCRQNARPPSAHRL